VRYLEKFLTIIVTTLFVLMILLVTLQTVNRYGMKFSIPWTEEATRTAYVVMIFFGNALAVVCGNHVRVLSVIKLLPARGQRALGVTAAMLSAVFFGFVAYGNYVYTVVNWGAVFPTIPFLMIGYVGALVLVSSVLTAGLFFFCGLHSTSQLPKENKEGKA